MPTKPSISVAVPEREAGWGGSEGLSVQGEWAAADIHHIQGLERPPQTRGCQVGITIAFDYDQNICVQSSSYLAMRIPYEGITFAKHQNTPSLSSLKLLV